MAKKNLADALQLASGKPATNERSSSQLQAADKPELPPTGLWTKRLEKSSQQ